MFQHFFRNKYNTVKDVRTGRMLPGFGAPKLTSFTVLKVSQRNCNLVFSISANGLLIDESAFGIAGRITSGNAHPVF